LIEALLSGGHDFPFWPLVVANTGCVASHLVASFLFLASIGEHVVMLTYYFSRTYPLDVLRFLKGDFREIYGGDRPHPSG